MHYKQMLRFFVPALFASFFIWPACQKTDLSAPELADHEAEFAFPLFNTTLNLKDLMLKVLNDTLSGDTIVVAPDGTMTLYYTGDVVQKPATDLFKSFTGGFFPLLDTIGASPIDTLEGVTIYRADLKKGRIQLTAIYSGTDTLTCKLRIPQMSKNGTMFTYNFTLKPQTTYYSPAIDVADYVLQSNSNTLEFIYEAYKPNGERVKIEPGMLISFETLEFSYLEGYWGYQRYSLIRDTIEIDINQTDLKGDVVVKNPKVTMRISNSWGFPTRGVVKYLSFIGQNGEEIPLVSSIFVDSAVDFNYPKFALGEIGQTKYTDLYLDETNSNIAQIFNAQPTRLIYEVDGISNVQQDPDIIGFLTDSSIISLQMQVELVLEGSARNFGAEQTLDLNFGDFGDIDTSNIQEVEFKLVTENGTPVASELQMYFLDEAGVALDSLFTDGAKFIMEAAPVNNEGIANGIKRTETFIQMPIERFNRIRTAKKAYLKTAFTTAEGGSIPVKLLADDKATVKMGMKVKTRY